MDKRRVVISGIGLVTPLGLGQSKNWNSLISGESGINLLNSFDASDLSCRIGGEIPSGTSSEGKLDLNEWLNIKEQRKVLVLKQQSDQGSIVLMEPQKLLEKKFLVPINSQKKH